MTRNQADRATGLLHNQVGVPLARGDGTHQPLGAAKNFKLGEFLAEQATRANLESILRGAIPTGRPALLFTGSHGVAFDSGDKPRSARGRAHSCHKRGSRVSRQRRINTCAPPTSLLTPASTG